MAKNPYFLDNTSEQRLIEDITKETISAMGRRVYYLPRQNLNKDYLYGESEVTRFKGSYSIVAYVNSVSGFEGQGDLITKFGIDLKDRVELVVSKKAFQELVSRVEPEINRPREGDLIYFPDSDTIFEINFVEHENPFYPLGKLYSYVLTCETFVYSNEEFDTDQSFIDDIEDEYIEKAFELYMNTPTDYIVGETVFHIIGNGPAGPTAPVITNSDGIATVYEWDRSKAFLILGNQFGSFNIEAGEYIYGTSSGAVGEITSYGNLNLNYSHNPIKNKIALDGIDLENEKDIENLFNFDETDPFSEGNY
jgi:hypothetical protein